MSEKTSTTRNLLADLPESVREFAAGELETIEGGYLVDVFQKYQLPTKFEPKNGPTVPPWCFPKAY